MPITDFVNTTSHTKKKIIQYIQIQKTKTKNPPKIYLLRIKSTSHLKPATK